MKNAAGEVIRSVEAYKSFNFAKYRYYRLVWGGLAPSTTYTLEMRRRSTADAERYLDSEWAAVQVTTDADPAADHADCLLYAISSECLRADSRCTEPTASATARPRISRIRTG